MKTLLLSGIVTFAVLTSAPGRADGTSPVAPGPGAAPVDKAACLDAVSKGQVLREAHKLVEAREQFRVCARAECPAVVRGDCTSWVVEVETALPTVVITAKDEAGRDIFDVDVSAEGQPLVSRLDGRAVPMNPGIHTLRLETADGGSLEQPIVVKEGVKNQDVGVVLHTRQSPTAAAATLPVSAPPVANGAGVESGQAQPTERRGSGAWRTVGWVAGAVGIVGLGVGTVFGVMAISDKSAAHCDASNACDAGPLHDANSAATASTVGIVAGGVLLAGGAALVLFAPGGRSPQRVRRR